MLLLQREIFHRRWTTVPDLSRSVCGMTAAVGTLCLSGYLTCQINVFLLLFRSPPFSYDEINNNYSSFAADSGGMVERCRGGGGGPQNAVPVTCVRIFGGIWATKKKSKVKKWMGPSIHHAADDSQVLQEREKITTNRGDKTRACERGEKLLIFICLFMIMIIFIKSFPIFVIKCKDVIFWAGWVEQYKNHHL